MTFRVLRIIPKRPGINQIRLYASNYAGIRERLLSEVRIAMKNKDAFASTTLRSVLSEIYTADKVSSRLVESPAILKIIRQATFRRNEAAAQFIKASRPDLAEKEHREARLLSALLPPLISTHEIDRVLNEVIAMQSLAKGDPREILGDILKTFYSKVDKSCVDPVVVKARASAILMQLSHAETT